MTRFLSRPEKILIIRLSSLGDIILATPMIRMLRRRFPGVSIDMLVKENFLPVLDNIPHIDKKWAFPHGNARKALVRRLSGENYDTVIDLQDTFTSRLITAGLNASSIYRFHRSRLNRWIRIHLPSFRANLRNHLPVMLGYLKAIEPLKVPDDGRGVRLEICDKDRKNITALIDNFAAENGITENTSPLVIAPGARHLTKTWPIENWLNFLELHHNEHGTMQVIAGGPYDTELANAIQSQTSHPVLDLTGKTTIPELAALISLASAVITGDSAPMHIAAAVDTPLVAIFGSTVPEFGFAPIRCRNRILEVKEITCRPCHAHGLESCPRQHFKCMKDIEASDVMTALKELDTEFTTVPLEQLF